MPPLRLLEFRTDIIEHINSHVPTSDLSAWRLTCREVGEAAAPFLLRNLDLHQHRVANVSRYIARFPASALYIRRLYLEYYCNEDTPSVHLLLERAKNVKHLIFGLQCAISIEVVHAFRYLQNLKLSGIFFEDLINLFRTPVSTLLRLAVTWKQLHKPVAASQFMSLLQQGAPGLQILDAPLDMREPLGPISVLPGIHTISLHRSFGINAMNLFSIFPGMHSLAIHNPRERYTPPTQPLCVLELPQLDVLAGDIEGLSWLHPYYMHATLLEVDDNPERSSALSQIVAGVRPEMLHLSYWSSDPRRSRALPKLQMPSVVVLQLTLQCTCGAADNSSSIIDTFHWRPDLVAYLRLMPALRFLRLTIQCHGAHTGKYQTSFFRQSRELVHVLLDAVKHLSLVAITQEDRLKRDVICSSRAYRRTITSGSAREPTSSVVDNEAGQMLARLSMEELRQRRDAMGRAEFDATLVPIRVKPSKAVAAKPPWK